MQKWVRHILIVLLNISAVLANSFDGQTDRETPSSFWRIYWANDIAYQTDYYFTNGMDIAWYSSDLHTGMPAKLHLSSSKDEIVFQSFSLRQDIFTPLNVNATDIQYGDRPYASYLLLSSRQTIINPSKRITRISTLQAGILGRFSGGERVQNGIHELLPSSKPVGGWQYQMNTDIALSYALSLEKNLLWTKPFRLNGAVMGRAGLPYTDAAVQLSWELGKPPAYYGYPFVTKSIKWFFYLRTQLGLEYRLYDATLQGGWMRRHNIYTLNTITPLRYTFGNAIVVGKGRFQIELGHKWKSSEFAGAVSHGYGYIGFQFGF